ncbi:MAG: response regulator [Acidobacteriaceae bacterium]
MSPSYAVSPQKDSSPLSAARPIVFIVDDDVSVRDSLSLQMRNEGWQTETFASAQEFLARPPATVPSCLILDLVLPGISGLDLQKLIADEWAVTPIIFITGYGDVRKTVQAMKAGAIEFLTKPLKDEMLLPAVRHALTRSQSALIHKAEIDRLLRCYLSLTPRERQVMHLVVLGRPNKHVADELCISEITVKAHRGRVMQKMQAGSLADLVKMAGKLHLGVGLHSVRQPDPVVNLQQHNVA